MNTSINLNPTSSVKRSRPPSNGDERSAKRPKQEASVAANPAISGSFFICSPQLITSLNGQIPQWKSEKDIQLFWPNGRVQYVGAWKDGQRNG